ncbi:MAG: methyltransferase domain-containing protein [Caldilineaceae bacterium]|nr:methyltransferase domain-containing protein [Caldilineaceae bacterium]
MNESTNAQKLLAALWEIYRRPQRPEPWTFGGNLPWDEPAFSERMLREHLDQAHGAASRVTEERQLQLDWIWSTVKLQAGMAVCDLTCGPGLYAVELAKRGCTVTGVDFGPAAVAYARQLATAAGVHERCTILQEDIRSVTLPPATFDVVLLIYGQLAVFTKAEAQALIEKAASLLKPGGTFVIELLNQDRVDKTSSNWWFTDDRGLWGDTPFLHLGERFWDDEQEIAYERFHILHLESGEYTEVHLCDQSYAVTTMQTMIREAGFTHVDVYPRWGGLPLYDADEWIVYVGRK